tara:strand:- start:599 stop:937 length:339 start_codon:yes stop_codon:yes gene_type:complete
MNNKEHTMKELIQLCEGDGSGSYGGQSPLTYQDDGMPQLKVKEADEHGVPDLEEVIALQSKMGEFMIKLKENMDHNTAALAELLKEQANFLTLMNDRIASLEDSRGDNRTLN